MQEWKAQADLEEEYDLKPSVMSSTDPIKEAESQIFFISHFLRPMLQLTVKAVPEMSCYLNHLKSNLRTWVKRKDELSKKPPQIVPPQVPQQRRQRQFDNETLKGIRVDWPSGVPPTSVPVLSCSVTDRSPCSSQFPSSPTLSSQNVVAAPLPRTQADSFMTAFPLTLPTHPPKKHLASDAGSVGWIRPTFLSSSAALSSPSVSEHGTGPLNSPSVESSSEFPVSRLQPQLFSPISEASLNMDSDRGRNNSPINSGAVAHRCRSNSSVSNSSACDQCGALSDPSSIGSSDSNVFRIWCSPTQFGSTSAIEAANDDDEKHASTPHAAIRNASLLGSLRQRRQRDVSGVVSLKEFTDRSSTPTSSNGMTSAMGLMPTPRRAVRYSWCAGMAGLNGDTEIMSAFRECVAAASNGQATDKPPWFYPTLSRVSSDVDSSPSSSPEMPSAATPSSSFYDDTISTTVPAEEDAPGSLSICPLSSRPTHAESLDSTLIPRLSSPPIKCPLLRVRSP
jgi:hypothetical protein